MPTHHASSFAKAQNAFAERGLFARGVLWCENVGVGRIRINIRFSRLSRAGRGCVASGGILKERAVAVAIFQMNSNDVRMGGGAAYVAER
jgi:hypothetical protein